MMMPLLAGNGRAGRGNGGMQQQVALMAGLMSMAAMMGAGNNQRGRGGFRGGMRRGSRGGNSRHPGDAPK